MSRSSASASLCVQCSAVSPNFWPGVDRTAGALPKAAVGMSVSMDVYLRPKSRLRSKAPGSVGAARSFRSAVDPVSPIVPAMAMAAGAEGIEMETAVVGAAMSVVFSAGSHANRGEMSPEAALA
ncbi:hypothetical protein CAUPRSCDRAFT_13200 [Caulochytrium protostelioides]|uniref:Uncharacterized protein n=1 Tax=Caulochytrium protostelioides TaxID=1555241 RepID=A0A4P9WV50_9FUNG|nr:hypothetical protein CAUPRSCDRAFT_13200 [Caulochytrium protostelioides]